MANFRDRRGPRFAMDHQAKSKDESKPIFDGRRNRKGRHVQPEDYRRRRGSFRTRRRILSVTLLTLVLVSALLGTRPLLSGEEVAANGDGPGGANQQQEFVSSGGQSGKTEGGASGAASNRASSAEAASAETTETGQATEPPATFGKEKLGEFRTDYRYSDSEDRKYNLRLSSQAVDGTVLGPGEIFSMNDNIAGLDYKEAKVFADGGETSALGGGLCQVTSTVYMAAQYAGLEIVERNPHYTTLPYIRPGFDATVWFGGQGIPELDMKFKNTTDSEILIREYITGDGLLTAEIWGQPTGMEVEMRSEKIFEDLQLGIKWATYKKVTRDEEIIYDGLLYQDIYSFPPPESVGDEGYNEVRVGGW